MKICPHCQTTYTDDTLQFCLQDGSPLTQTNTQNWSESETLVASKYSTNKGSGGWQPINSNADSYDALHPPLTPKKAGTGLTVALTVLVTLLLVGGGVAGFLIYQHNNKTETAQNVNVNVKPVNTSTPANTNANQKNNANANVNASPTASPSAKPALNPKDAEEVKSDVKDVIENWKDATENRDLDSHLDNYADTVDYYKAGKVSLAKVRADKEKAYSMYDDIEVNISNIKITPDQTGEKATAVFDKEWNFQNEERSNSGKVQQQLTFSKIGGAWRITGEKDLNVYYVNKGGGE